ncbi:UNVERIFIED_CONTAM: hypothetical protein DES50_12038 [Williamsia faeni]
MSKMRWTTPAPVSLGRRSTAVLFAESPRSSEDSEPGTQRVRSSLETGQQCPTPQTRKVLPHYTIQQPSTTPTICKHPQPQVQNPSSVSSSLTGGTTFALVRRGNPASNATRTGPNTTPMLPTARRAAAFCKPSDTIPIASPTRFHSPRRTVFQGPRRRCGGRVNGILSVGAASAQPQTPTPQVLSVADTHRRRKPRTRRRSAPSHVPQIISRARHQIPASGTGSLDQIPKLGKPRHPVLPPCYPTCAPPTTTPSPSSLTR